MSMKFVLPHYFVQALFRNTAFGWKSTVSALAIAIAMSPPVQAQETAGQINGLITTAAGAPAAGVEVKISHVPSGTTTVVTTNADGRFIGRGLRLGGPYNIVITASGGQPETVTDDIFISLGLPYELDYPLGGRQAAIEEMVVSGTATTTLQAGPSSQFEREYIERAPVTSVNRDLKDIIRLDPKVKIDRFNSDAIQIAGTNNRFNLLTIDGVRQNDDFGLNNGGYPSARTPLSIDVIDQLSVNTAPFAVTYSGFQGGNVNIVTKSGTNDFHGSAYFYYTDDSLIGNKSGIRPITGLSFTDKTYGGTLSGPIVRDKLFFFAGYEKFETGNPVARGPAGSGFANEVASISQADFDLVKQVAQTVYNYDTLGLPKDLPESDEKWFIKANWNINDDHKFVASHNHDKGSLIVQTGPAALVSAPASLSAASDWYSNIQSVDSVSAQLFSDWSDSLKTEFKYGYKYQTGRPTPLGETPFPEMQIITGGGGILSIGPDQFRHFNAVTNELHTIKAKADYLIGEHTVTAGYEREMLSVFNAFLPSSYGVYLFNSIADFQARQADRLVFQNAVSGNTNDAAASFKSNIDSFYVQDSWHITPDLTLTGGLRYELYSSGDRPIANANFLARYGFSNTSTYDGRDLFLPRLSFNWKAYESTVVRGGFGLFGGGNPNVWLSNSFSNTGVATSTTTIRRTDTNAALVDAALNNVTGVIPAIVQQQLAAGDGSVNAVDPNFKIPSTWKFNLGVDHTFDLGWLGNDYLVTADIIYGRANHAALWIENRVIPTGTAPDGRPIYSRRPGVPTSGNDLILTNTNKGDTFTLSLQAAKKWKNTGWGDFDVQLGYAYNRARDVNPGTSSTAQSNWDNLATSDINNPGLATSNYELRHNGTLAVSWSKALLFDDYKTTISMFGNAYSGHPYSYTFSGASSVFGDPRQSSRQRQLFYVPIDQTDVVLAGGLTWDALNSYIIANGLDKYRGKIAPRNAFTSPPVGVVDMHFEQEIPGFFQGAKGKFIMNISNLTNLINNNWGRLVQYDFPYVVPVVQATGVSGGKYIYSGPIQTPNKRLAARQSVWGINFGVRYEF